MKNFLTGAGFTETFTYIFTSEKLLETFESSPAGLLEVENPTSLDTQYLAERPAFAYVRMAAENLVHVASVKLFGIATGFRPQLKPSATEPVMETKYLVLVSAAKETKSTRGMRDGEVFYTVKGVVESLLESLGVSDHWFDDALSASERERAAWLHPYRAALVKAGDVTLGTIGELNPAVAERIKAKGRIVVAELEFDALVRVARTENEYQPAGRFPTIIRDIAISVPENTKADDIEGVIQTAGGKLLIDADLFDYFQDEAMTERGEKSLAFHLVFQSLDRTLTDAEVHRVYQNIVSALKENSWEVRE